MTQSNEKEAPKYPLANDASGNPLDVPAEAVAWRVRKLARRAGRPKVLFDVETGRPLELPITVTYDDFIEHVNESGRFRLEAVDAQARTIAGCVAITEVILDDDESPSTPMTAAETLPHLHQLVAHLVDANTQVMKAMASAFGNVQPRPVQIEMPVGAVGGVAAGGANQLIETMGQIGTMVNQLIGAIAAHKNGVMAAAAPSPKVG